jgi:transposase-like protein
MSLPKIYTDETAARRHLEKLQWPDGPVCPHCGIVGEATKLEGKSTRPGVYKCRPCQKPFKVTVGTVFEDSHVPLHKWLYAAHLLTASKKGFSSHQLHRTLKVSYKTAWFMSHRIREAMRPAEFTPMGGAGKTVEVDETIIGKIEGAPKRLRPGMGWGSWRNIALTLVERGGSARSFHVSGTTLATLLPIIRMNISRESHLMTDAAPYYKMVGKEFASHGRVEHAVDEYVRREGARVIHTNTVEGYYSIFKRGMKGIYQHCSEKHLHRYLSEYDFRYNYRVRLGYDDAMRLTYRRSHTA